jgi:hypothetical protein
MADIELADVLVGLRRELARAQTAAAAEFLRFRVDAIDLEIKVGVTSKEGVKAGLKFWVLELGGDAGRELEHVQTLRLKLAPVNSDGSDTLVSDRDKK